MVNYAQMAVDVILIEMYVATGLFLIGGSIVLATFIIDEIDHPDLHSTLLTAAWYLICPLAYHGMGIVLSIRYVAQFLMAYPVLFFSPCIQFPVLLPLFYTYWWLDDTWWRYSSQRRMKDALARDTPAGFSALLDRYYPLVYMAGSYALQPLVGKTWPDSDIDIICNWDMNFHPSGYLIGCFETMGYEQLFDDDRPSIKYPDALGVARMKHPAFPKTVDLVFIDGRSCDFKFLRLYYANNEYDDICLHTDSIRNMTSPYIFNRNTTPDVAQSRMRKYIGRGFNVEDNRARRQLIDTPPILQTIIFPHQTVPDVCDLICQWAFEPPLS